MDDVNVRELVHLAGSRKDWHSHDSYDFVLTLSGCSTEWFTRSHYERSERTVLFRPAGARHRDCFSPMGARHLLFEFSAGWVDGFPRSRSALEQPQLCRFGPIAILAERAYREWLEDDNASGIAVQALALEMVAHLIREGQPRPGARSPLWLRKVKERIDEGFAQTPSLAELANIAGVHPTHLARQFRHHYRRTIGECLRQRRVDAARELLVHSHLSLTEIALDTGFAHQAHFSVIFKRFVGLTPGEFRRLFRQSNAKMDFESRSHESKLRP